MKRMIAFILALMMLFALCACGKEDDPPAGGSQSTDAPVTGNDGDTATDAADPDTEEEGVTAIGVANPYTQITAAELPALFGISLNVPVGASEVCFFDINTGGDTHMLQLQFVYEGVQYVLRGKAAARLTNISAAFAQWDSEKDCEIGGCEGQICLSSGGAGAVLWYDSTAGFTYALSAASGAEEETLAKLAQTLYVPADPGDAPADDGSTGEDEDPATEGQVPPPPAAQETEVRVCYPAADGVSFTYVTFTTKEVSAEYLINKLIGLGVLSSNVSAQWLEGMAIDEAGSTELALSLSPSFGTLLKTLSAQEEYMLMGCIVNTFLEAYDAVRIWIYVDGSDPVSATKTYSEPLKEYGSYDPSAQPGTEEPDTEDEDIPTPDAGDLTLAEKICELAKSKVGAEYVYGGTGPDTFDNSGFVYYCFKENGIDIPRRTTEMYKEGTAVGQDDLQPGDVVFFTYEDDRSPSYVGIYLGDGKFIAENREGVPVAIMDMTTQYFQDIYIGARRYT